MKNQIEIKTLDKLNAEIEAPPSKAHTLRALFIAAMAKGDSILRKPLIAKDQKYAMEALKDLGVEISYDKDKIKLKGVDGHFRTKKEKIFIGNSGVTARVLTVLGSLADRDIIIDGTERMRTGRPIQDLIEAIEPLGIEAESLEGNGCPPIRVKGESFKGGTTKLRGDKSSQYFSAILLCAPYANQNVIIKTKGDLVSKPYLDITLDMMKEFGVEAVNENYKKFMVSAEQEYIGKDYTIEGDYSSASFFFAAASIMRGKVRIKNLNPNSTQGDRDFVKFLEMMGCEINKGDNWVEVIGKPLKGIKVDMKNYPDIVVPLAVVAAFAEGESEFYNIAHLKYKESDRLKAPVNELKKMGVEAKATDDSIVVKGGEPKGAEIDTYKDHRMVMSFAVAGLKVPGVVINNPENVEKSFPDFFKVFKKLYEGEK